MMNEYQPIAGNMLPSYSTISSGVQSGAALPADAPPSYQATFSGNNYTVNRATNCSSTDVERGRNDGSESQHADAVNTFFTKSVRCCKNYPKLTTVIVAGILLIIAVGTAAAIVYAVDHKGSDENIPDDY